MIEVKKIAIPFAQSGNKSIIYDNRQSGQAENEATWSTGFPPITMIRKEDGGLPPTGLDFNGIFYDISSNIVFSCMGGQYKFDKDYAEKIGGYPKGAILLNNQENKQYISNTNNNKLDFNSANTETMTEWSVISIADIDKILASKIDNVDLSQSLNQKANVTTQINAGKGLTGGGNLSTSRTLDLGTPTTISQDSKNTVSADSHTHEIIKATTSQMGIVQLTNTIDNSQTKAPTPNAIKSYVDSQMKNTDTTPVGTIQAFIGEIAPNDRWLLCRGQSFSASNYPDLAKLLPDLKIPDLRGVALRGLDANRGIDPNRKLLSYQEDAMQSIRANLSISSSNYGFAWTGSITSSGAIKVNSSASRNIANTAVSSRQCSDGFVFDSSYVTRSNSQNETVMKNVAVNFIIKAR